MAKDNTERFTERANDYAKYRPKYPKEYIDYVTYVANLTQNSIIADMGAGTGILTKQLSERCKSIIAVEPNSNMLKICKENLAKCNNVKYVNSPAENTGIQDCSVDLITAAQSFHWFNTDEFLAECKRIAKPSAKVSLVWNNRSNSPHTDKLRQLFASCCERENFKGFSGGIAFGKNFNGYGFFKNDCFEVKQFKNDILYTLEEFIGRNISSSNAPLKGSKNYDKFLCGLKEIFAEFSQGGILTDCGTTKSYTGEI